MKNILMGFVGSIVLMYSILISLTIYGIKLRENEMNRTLSQIGIEALENNYVPEFLRTEDSVAWSVECSNAEKKAKKQLKEDVEQCSNDDSQVEITILCCDMDKGLLSFEVKQDFSIPFGRSMSRSYARTILVDREV